MFSAVEFNVTGAEMVQAFTAIHGTPPTIKPFTPEDEAKLVQNPPMGPAYAGHNAAWAGVHPWGYGQAIDPPQWTRQSFEAVARQYV